MSPEAEDETTRFVNTMNELKSHLTELRTFSKNLLQRLREEKYESEKGISLLELKHRMVLNYLLNIAYLLLRKLNKKSISGDEAILRVAEIRTILERIRPIERKLQYHIDKLIKIAVTGADTNRDVLSYKPNPNQMAVDESDESDASEAEKKAKKTKKYVPPKLVAAPFDEERTEKRPRLNRMYIQDLQEEFGHGPEEIMEYDGRNRQAMKQQLERQQFEEENFVRLPKTKRKRKLTKKAPRRSKGDPLLRIGGGF